MTVIKAQLHSLRKSPFKVQIVARQLKGKTADEALAFLRFLGKGSALPLMKLISSAVADAENNFNLDKKNLKIDKIIVLKGPMYKRVRPRSRGMAHPILKKTTHINLFLTDGKAQTKTAGADKNDHKSEEPAKAAVKKENKRKNKSRKDTSLKRKKE